MYVCVQQTSVNAQGLVQLAARIGHIIPIVNDMAHTNPSKGQAIVQELQQVLASMTQDLKDARSKGQLNQFFNSADNASALGRHNMVLNTMIADSMLVTVNEVLRSLYEIERSLQKSSSTKRRIGWHKKRRSHRRRARGGGGDRCGGPQLKMSPDECYRIDNISRGTGGTGGIGIDVGGKGGTVIV
ncbi:hypothetical protein B0H14DRAFT_3889808 [Mycena olivaceomarginata]|nr:hypothetical protein B0H14DRAFT_3889808 [Mycena olivaceomarginata]